MVLPKNKAPLLLKLNEISGLNGEKDNEAIPTAGIEAGVGSDSNSSESQSSTFESFGSQSSGATSNSSFSGRTSAYRDLQSNRSLDIKQQGPGENVKVDIIPQNKMRGYVLFGVQGSRRLQSPRTQLTHIDVETCKDDDSFFDELRIQYKTLRGYTRWIFSIWVFRTCEFIMVCSKSDKF